MDIHNLNGDCWQDITEEFKSYVEQLNLGELLKADQFTLLEAMSAIELMDPKMDSGMIFKRTDRQILTLEQSIRAGRVKISNLEPNELIGIIDDTYACLVTWLDGNPLSQTVMTNLYLHDTERIEDRCLRVFSQAMLKIADFLDRLVQMCSCVEEEDFQLNYGKFNLATQVSEQKVLTSLEDLCLHYERLQTERKQQQQQSTNSSTSHNNQQLNYKDDGKKSQPVTKVVRDDREARLMTAIATRLRFTHNLYASLWNISKNLLKDYSSLSTISDPNQDAAIKKTVKLFQGYMSNCDQSLEKCLNYIDKWTETIDMGVKPVVQENQEHKNSSNSVDYPTIMGFDPLINHKLLPPIYPRCPSIKTRPVTVEYLKDLIKKLRECIILSNNFYQKSFNRSLETIEQFSKYRQPRSCVISRSFLQVLNLPYRVVSMLKEELYQSISDFCESMVRIMKKDVTKTLAVNEFLEECLKIFGHVITIYGHNPARQHEKFFDLILSFKNLQYSAFLVNDVLKNNLVYSWTTYFFAKFCIKYVLSGLELELFSPHEYPYVFWYLYDILYRNEKEQLEYAKQLLIESQLALDQEQANNQSSKQTSKIKGSAKKNKKKTQLNTVFHEKNLLLNDALRFLTGGMFLLTYGLKLQGKIRSPSFEFTSEEICFDHRFGSITGNSVFQAFKFTLSRLEKIESIYREAFECFSEARILFEKYGEGQEECLTVCKTNMVVAKILSSNSNSFVDREVEFCFDRHPSFPTVKL